MNKSRHTFEEDSEMRSVKLAVSPKLGPSRNDVSASRKGILKPNGFKPASLQESQLEYRPTSPKKQGLLSPDRTKRDNFTKSRDKLFFGQDFPALQLISHLQKKLEMQTKAGEASTVQSKRLFSPYSPPREGAAPVVLPEGFYPSGRSPSKKTMFSDFEEKRSYWNPDTLSQAKQEQVDWRESNLYGYYGRNAEESAALAAEASKQRQRSKSLSSKAVEQDLKFRIQMALTNNDRHTKKGHLGSGGQAASSQAAQMCKESLLEEYLNFVRSNAFRESLNEQLVYKIRSYSYKEGVLVMITEMIKLQEQIGQERTVLEHRLQKKELELREREDKANKKIEELVKKLNEVCEEGKKSIADYETRLAVLQADTDECRRVRHESEEQLMIFKLKHNEEVADLKQTMAEIESVNKQLVASSTKIDLKYVETVSNQLAEAQGLLSEERTKLSILKQRHEQEVYEVQLDLIKAKKEIKTLKDSKQDLEEAGKDKEMMISKLKHDLVEQKSKTETKQFKELQERVTTLEKELVLQKADADKFERSTQEMIAKEKLLHLAKTKQLESDLMVNQVKNEAQVKLLSEQVMQLKTENLDLKKAAASSTVGPSSPKSKPGDFSPSPRSTANSSPRATNFSLPQSKAMMGEQLVKAQQEIESLKQQLSLSQDELALTTEKLTKATTSLRTIEQTLVNKYEQLLKGKDDVISELNDFLKQLREGLKAEEDKRYTLERILMNVSASARTRDASAEQREAGYRRAGESSFVRLLDKIKEGQKRNMAEGELVPTDT